MNTPENTNAPDSKTSAHSRGDEIVAALASLVDGEASAEDLKKIQEWVLDNHVYFLHPKNLFWLACSEPDNDDPESGLNFMGLNWPYFQAVLCDQSPEVSAWLTKEKDAPSLIPVFQAAIIRQKSVDAVGSIAGYCRGLHILPSGSRFLATKSQRYIAPVSGDYKAVYDLLVALFGVDTRELASVLGWMKIAMEDLMLSVESSPWDKRIRPRQALIIIGPPNAGKSLFALLLQHMFGGAKVDPSPYFEGTSNFNGDLVSATLLLADDNVESRNPASRRRLGQAIKQFLVVGEKRFHAKYMEAFSAPSYHSIVVLGNEESLAALPIIDDSLKDKVILVKATKSELVSQMRTNQERADWVQSLVDALPAFVDFLVNHFEIPDNMRDPRFGLAAFADDDLLSDMNNDDEKVYDMYYLVMDSLRKDALHSDGVRRARGDGKSWTEVGKFEVGKNDPKLKVWKGSGIEFERYVRAVGEGKLNPGALFPYNQSCGAVLRTLSLKFNNVKKNPEKSNGLTVWKIAIVEPESEMNPDAPESGEPLTPPRNSRELGEL